MRLFNGLPVETVLQIIKECRLPQSIDTPIIGSDAAWQPWSSLSEFQKNHIDTAVEDNTYRSTLKALRLTNKAMNTLVEPYLFEEVNMFFDQNPGYGKCVQAHVTKPQGKHVRVIRANVDSALATLFLGIDEEEGGEGGEGLYWPLMWVTFLANVIADCPNVRSLGLYHHHWETDFTPITEKIIPLIEKGTLVSLGIYSLQIMRRSSIWPANFVDRGTSGPIKLLNEVAASVVSNLKALDIVEEWMPCETYAALQVSPAFAQLTSLTVRYAFRHNILWVSDTAERLGAWTPRMRLTRLQLISCQTVYAPDIPILVGLFETLEELLVSTCGHGDDVIPPRRSPGWSAQPDALWKRKVTLKEFVIEHMSRWEILALGIIPSLTVVCANVWPAEMLNALEEDGELFPATKLLRVLPNKVLQGGEGENSSEEPNDINDSNTAGSIARRLDAVCEERKVEVRRDASRYRPCTCCRY